MPAKDLGNKYVCFKCSTKFYDLKKPDPLCPKCGANQKESPALKPASEGRRGRLAAVPKVIEPTAPVEGEEPELVEEDEAEGFEDEEDVEAAAPDDEDI